MIVVRLQQLSRTRDPSSELSIRFLHRSARRLPRQIFRRWLSSYIWQLQACVCATEQDRFNCSGFRFHYTHNKMPFVPHVDENKCSHLCKWRLFAEIRELVYFAQPLPARTSTGFGLTQPGNNIQSTISSKCVVSVKRHNVARTFQVIQLVSRFWSHQSQYCHASIGYFHNVLNHKIETRYKAPTQTKTVSGGD